MRISLAVVRSQVNFACTREIIYFSKILHVLLLRVVVVSWCCGSPNDVTFRPFCVSRYHKVQVFIQPLQILISANECKISVGLSVPTNSLTTFDLIKQGFN